MIAATEAVVRAQCDSVSPVPVSSACANDTIILYDSAWANLEGAQWDHCPGDLNREPSVTNFGNIQNALTYPRNISIVKDGNIWYGFINNISASTIYRLNFGGSLSNNPVLDTLVFTPSAANPGNSSCKLLFNKSGGNWYGIQVTDANRMLIHQFGNSLGNNNISTQVYANPFSLLSNSRDMALVKQNDSLFAFVININSNNISHFAFGTDLSNGPIAGSNFTVLSDSSLMTGSGSIDAVKHCDQWYVFVGSQGTDNIARVKIDANFDQVLSAGLIASSNQIVNPQSIEVVQDSGNWVIFAKTNAGGGLLRIVLGDSLENAPVVHSLGPYNNTINGSLALSMDMVRDGTKWHCFVANAHNGNERIVRLSYPEPCDPLIFNGGYPSQLVASSAGTYQVSFAARRSNGSWLNSMTELTIKNAPVVAFDVAGNCFGDSTHFTDSTQSEETISGWDWDFDNGQVSVNQHPSILYSDSGNYEVSLTATNATGCSGTLTETVRIHPNPTAAFITDSICQFSSLWVSDSSYVPLDSIVQHRWIVAGDTQFAAEPSLVLDDTGSFNIQLKVISGAGCTDSTSAITFVRPSPELAFSVDATCTQDTTQFDNQSSIIAGSVQYKWLFGDGDSSLAFAPAHVYDTAGTYGLQLIGIADNGCADTLATPMVISVKPDAGIALPTPPFCTRVALNLTDTGNAFNQPVIARSWDFGDGNSSTDFSPTHSYIDTGSYVVVLETFTGTQCSDVDSVEIQLTESPVVDFEYSGHCKRNTLTFNDSSYVLGLHSLDTLLWVIGGDTLSGESITWPTGAESEVHVLHEVKASNGCVIQVDSSIALLDEPIVSMKEEGSLRCTSLDKWFETAIEVDATDSITSWHWTARSSGVLMDTGAGSAYALNSSSSGSHTVRVEIQTDAGCNAVDSVELSLIQSPVLDILVPDKSCFGLPSSFASNYSGSNYSVTWDFGDGLTGESSEVQHQYFQSGIFNVQCEILDKATGCFDTTSKSHQVLEKFEIAFETQQVCSSTPATLELQPTIGNDTISAVVWDVSNVGTFIGMNPSVVFGDTNSHVVTIDATTANGCQAQASGTILPEQGPLMDPIWRINSLEPPYEVSFDAQSEYENSVVWVIDGDSLPGERQLLNFASEKEITATVIAQKDSICLLTQSFSVSVTQPEIDLAMLDTRVEASDSGYVCHAEVANQGNALIRSFEVTYTLNNQARLSNSYQINLLPGSSKWVKARAGLDLNHNPLDVYCFKAMHDQFHLELDTHNNARCASLDEAHHIPAPYPNPFDESFQIELHLTSLVENIQVEVYTMKGQLIRSESMGSLDEGVHWLTVHLPGLSQGMYVIHLSATDLQARYILSKR